MEGQGKGSKSLSSNSVSDAKGFDSIRSINVLIALLLVVGTLIVYWQIQHHEFTNYDDGLYVTDNAQVLQGLTWQGLHYAFAEADYGYWQPLTWLSLMADRQLYLDNAGGYHWTSLLFHIANTIILFFVLRSMTGAPWQCGFVAALFALHPLHVEAVAWIAARKEVLSGFFWTLTIGAYAFYVRKTSLYRYLLICFTFTLGMMAKPTVVTLPFVLLLIDYWPLRRTEQAIKVSPYDSSGLVTDGKRSFQSPWLFLILEKIPLIVLTVVLGLISFILPVTKADNTGWYLENVPFLYKLQHVSISYMSYLQKVFYPSNLAAFYPRADHLPVSQVIVAACVLLAITLLVFLSRRKRPYLVVGWLWYLGTLLPVIGLIQAWTHEIADRYTYLPLIGIFIMMGWGIGDVGAIRSKIRSVMPFLAGLCLVGLMPISWYQVSHWRNSETLWGHSLEVTDHNWWYPHYKLGSHYAEKNDIDRAIHEYKLAISYSPENAAAHNNLAVAFVSKGDHPNALQELMIVIRLKPDHAGAHNNIAMILYGQEKISEAVPYFREAIRLQPSFANAHFYLAMALDKQGKTAEAEFHFARAAQINSNYRR